MKIQGFEQNLLSGGDGRPPRTERGESVGTEMNVPYGGGLSAEITISQEGLSLSRDKMQNDSLEKLMEDRERHLPVFDGFYEHYKMMSEYERQGFANLKRDGEYDAVNVARVQQEAYADAYRKIKEGYRNGTREIWAAYGDGTVRKRTEEEDLELLDQAYKVEMDFYGAFVRILENKEWMKKYGAESCGAPDEVVKDFHKALMESMEKAQQEFVAQYSYKDSAEENVKKAGSILCLAWKEKPAGSILCLAWKEKPEMEIEKRLLELSKFLEPAV